MIDKEEIIRALTLWFQPGDVFEIRALKAITPARQFEHTESGYFDYDHIRDAADAIGQIRFSAGVYVTVNPVKRDLLARAVNRIRYQKDAPTTADSNILRRKWLLIDCDPVRESGIASSEEEHLAAIEKAKEIRNILTAEGWPLPILIDSGNGAHLIYRIDLPTDDAGLVQKVLDTLGKASSKLVEIDASVFNPARIVRIPGTMNCKGDDADGSACGRPHRMAKLLEVPSGISTVTEEQLHALVNAASQMPAQEEADSDCATYENDVYTEYPGFDIERWIAEFAPDAGEPVPYKDGRKWVFKVCPFNPEHSNRSAVITEAENGAIGFRCLHNGCSGNDWRKLRVLREPGCYDQREADQPGVDLGGILSQESHDKKQDVTVEQLSDVAVNLVPLPKTLYHVPGFIHDVMKFCLDTAPSPQPELAFAAAIALQGHLAGRKVECLSGIRTNTYIVMLAPSGNGKNHPRRVVRRILAKIGLGNEIFEDSSSGQGVEDLLTITPAVLWLSDEIYEMLQAIINDKTGTKEKIMKILLTLHTSAGDDYTTRVKAGTRGTIINCPHLTLLGACTSEGFFNSINENIIGHGMFARMNLFQSDEMPEPKIPGNLNKIPPSVEHHALQWKNFTPTGSGNIDIVAKEVVGDGKVMSLLREYQLEAFREKKKLMENGEPDWKLSLWSRAFESIVRFALIYACSEAKIPDATSLSVDGLRWAHELVLWDIKNKLAMVQKFYYKTDFERISEQIVHILQRWHTQKGWDKPMPGWIFNRKTKELPPKVKDAAIQSLQAQERINVSVVQTAGRDSKTYSLCH